MVLTRKDTEDITWPRGDMRILSPSAESIFQKEKFLHKTQLFFSGKLSCNWLIMVVTMATPISWHVKDKNSIFNARDEDMIFY